MGKLWIWTLAAFLAFGSMDADAARRMGGGSSMGRQSSNVTQRQAAPARAPAQQARPAPAPQAAPIAPARSRWGGMLGGLAAGLGIAWLFHSMGMGGGSGMGGLVMLALLGFVAFAAWKWHQARKASQAPAYAGAGMPGAARVQSPWGSPGAQPSGGLIGSGIGAEASAGGGAWGVPAGFDEAGFLAKAKEQFVSTQSAWDRSDVDALRGAMTDGMLAEAKREIAKRDAEGAGSGAMRIQGLQARLLGIEEGPLDHLASVEFEGERVEGSGPAEPFLEVWNLEKPKAGGSGWLLAGMQVQR